jgi:two-component system, OmpR family, sensor histidine kinase KdpD
MDVVDPMNFNQGPSPQEILEGIRLEEAQRNKGRLKIFLGMAAGVGKTYAMLEEAQVLKKEQIDVVVANIEAHQRIEIEILLKNLPQVPKTTLFYKDKEFNEIDVEAIISLNPSIVLVDELAHSNIPGSKNAKRWQDVLDILDHGISVHTTLNVQHIDSLKDIIFDITKLVVIETVPDKIIEKAHSIQLIDLTPDELLQRLKEGKVYADTEGQSRIAAVHFFQKNNLAALREIVLRYVADKIDIDLMRMITTKEGRIEWKNREKFLVAISHNSQSQKLIKATRRLANQANASWVAVYVNTGKAQTKEEDEQLEKNLTLIRSLGAEIVTVYDPDIAEGIKKVAYQRDITQIILGRTSKNLNLSIFQGPTLLDKLTAECKNIDLHVIRQEKNPASYEMKRPFYSWQSKLSDYLSITFCVGLIAGLSWVTLFLLGYRVAEFLFFIGVSALGVFYKRGPTLLAAVLFGLIWGFFFIPHSTEFSFSVTNDVVLLVLYVLTAISIGIFAQGTWEQKELLRKGDEKTTQLKEILRYLDSNLALHVVLISLEENLPKVVDGMYKFFIKNSEGGLDMDNISALVGNKESMTAQWVFENGHEAGWSTERLSLSENLYLPLKGGHGIIGLLIFRPHDNRLLTLEERNLIYHLCHQLTNYLENSTTLKTAVQHDQSV